MPKFRTLTPGASPMHFFGSEVRRAREAAGMSQAELGDLVPCDKATVSRIETGLLAPDEAFARACDVAFPHMDGWFTRFLNESGNWAPRFEPSFRPFAEDEEDASAILIAEHSVMPGLLQTSTYARTLLAAHPGVSEADVENGVAGRMTRQVILDRENPPALWVVLDEMALHREVGGPEIMAAQLRHLARIARRPHVTVQVLTTRAHPGVQGAINIVEKTGVPAVAYMEDFADGRIVDDRATVAGLLDRFRHLQSSALPAVASLELIERLVEQRCAQEQNPDGGSAPTAAALPPHAWKSASPAT